MCYSADGQFVIAGGQSKNVCIYNVAEGILLKKFEITQNQSFDAVLVSNLNWKCLISINNNSFLYYIFCRMLWIVEKWQNSGT